VYGNYSAFGTGGWYTVASNYAYRNVAFSNHGHYFQQFDTPRNRAAQDLVPWVKPQTHTSHNLGHFKTQKLAGNRALMSDGFGNGASRNKNLNLTYSESPQIIASTTKQLPECADGWWAHKDGYNVLYGDGSCKWYGDPQQKFVWVMARYDLYSYNLSFPEQYDGCNTPEFATQFYYNYSYPGNYSGVGNGAPWDDKAQYQYMGSNWNWHQLDMAAGIDVDTTIKSGPSW
jgi:prepilin-type processing-associated H-X9-DG protein